MMTKNADLNSFKVSHPRVRDMTSPPREVSEGSMVAHDSVRPKLTHEGGIRKRAFLILGVRDDESQRQCVYGQLGSQPSFLWP